MVFSILKPAQIDRVVSLCPVVIPLGFAIGWLTGAFATPAILVMLGAMGGSFAQWRRERGLWMLAALFLSLFGPFYGLAVYTEIMALFGGRPPGMNAWIAVDLVLSTAILGILVRFLWSVIWWNRRVGEERESSSLDDDFP